MPGQVPRQDKKKRHSNSSQDSSTSTSTSSSSFSHGHSLRRRPQRTHRSQVSRWSESKSSSLNYSNKSELFSLFFSSLLSPLCHHGEQQLTSTLTLHLTSSSCPQPLHSPADRFQLLLKATKQAFLSTMQIAVVSSTRSMGATHTHSQH